MGAKLLQLFAHIFFDVLEGIEEGSRNDRGSGAILDSRAQILFAGVHQSAIRMIDDHNFLGAQQKHQRTTTAIPAEEGGSVLLLAVGRGKVGSS